DGQGARPHDPALAAAAGGSRDRVMDRRAFVAGSVADNFEALDGKLTREPIDPLVFEHRALAQNAAHRHHGGDAIIWSEPLPNADGSVSRSSSCLDPRDEAMVLKTERYHR